MADEDLRIGSPVDDLDVDTIDDLIDWLVCAGLDCETLSGYVKSCSDQRYLTGRAEAFRLAAALLRDVQYKIKMLGEVEG